MVLNTKLERLHFYNFEHSWFYLLLNFTSIRGCKVLALECPCSSNCWDAHAVTNKYDNVLGHFLVLNNLASLEIMGIRVSTIINYSRIVSIDQIRSRKSLSICYKSNFSYMRVFTFWIIKRYIILFTLKLNLI